jgi:aspartyl-tRNA(Asn)/glutamyl-tRNA(Gln) amidotransferase subunit B
MTAELVDYAEAVSAWEPVIGLETHVELGTRTKMFCGCPTDFGAEPNTQTCPVCLGLPGSLPVLNGQAVRSTVLIGLALHCDIAAWCRFARKNYFYPDQPKNYQISQYDEPICTDGYLDVVIAGDGDDRHSRRTIRVEIERVHMEEDTGKSLHVGGAAGRIHGATHSLVDYNRAGIPLVEIVTRPVEAGANAPAIGRSYVEQLAELLRTLDVSDVRLEQGSLRCDVNTSLRRPGAEYGTRTETKNVNSYRSVERAVRFEVSRQAGLLEAGERIKQETRHFHEDSGTTSPGRSKEEATDYRYFPEPDLVPIAFPVDVVAELLASLPETPAVRRARLRDAYGWNDLELEEMTNAGVLDLVVATVELGAAAPAARALWQNEVAKAANELGVDAVALPVSPTDVARLLALVADGTLTAALSRQALAGVLAGEGDVDAVVAARGLAVVSDDGALREAIDAVVAAQPDTAAKVRGGNLGAVGPLIGAVMKATGGKADAAKVRSMLVEVLA